MGHTKQRNTTLVAGIFSPLLFLSYLFLAPAQAETSHESCTKISETINSQISVMSDKERNTLVLLLFQFIKVGANDKVLQCVATEFQKLFRTETSLSLLVSKELAQRSEAERVPFLRFIGKVDELAIALFPQIRLIAIDSLEKQKGAYSLWTSQYFSALI
jgi:hypothetical protein